MGQLRPGALLKVKTIKGNKAQVSVAGGISLAVGRADNRPSIQPRHGWIEAKNLAYSGETAQQLKEAWHKEIAAASALSPAGEAKPASSVVNIRARNNQDYSALVVALEDVETRRIEPDTKQHKVNDNVWLFTQDKDAYAIQLFSLLNIEKARTISKEASFRDRAHLYTAQINNKQWAILLLGPYANAAAAEVAHQALPADYAGLGIVRLISIIASQRCAIRDRLDAEQFLGLDAFCL
jgi:septal ring-binding cell division protein DamX